MVEDLAQRSITSVTWNVAFNLVRTIVGFGQQVMLARLLPVDIFGVYAAAFAIVMLTNGFASFGMGGAFLHQTEETENTERAAAVHLTLKSGFTLVWTALVLLGAYFFVDESSADLRLALIVTTLAYAVVNFTQTPQLILRRRVLHRRLAFMQMVDVLLSAIISITLALRGATLWALLSTGVVTAATYMVFLYVLRPIWRPRLGWEPRIGRYFLRFGASQFVARTLNDGLDRVDDLWTAAFLGQTPLGFYSRAYNFARYPSIILADPIDRVSTGAFAEAAIERARLSRAFSKVVAVLVRSGFLLVGLIWVIAPELIELLLGAKWLPMVDAFRLMLPFTMLNPMKNTLSSVFVAVGKPNEIVKIRAIQFVVLLAGLFLLGIRFNILGVALAVDLMLLAGIALYFRSLRDYVDFSLRRLFAVPVLAVIVGGFAALSANFLLVGASDTSSIFVRGTSFIFPPLLILILLDRDELRDTFRYLNKYYFRKKR